MTWGKGEGDEAPAAPRFAYSVKVPDMRRSRRPAFAIAAVVCLGILGVALARGSWPAPGGPGAARAGEGDYVAAAVKTGEIRRTITASGTLNAILNVEVGSQLSGQIAAIHADFNDTVTRGQPLAELDRRSFEARRAEAQAALEIARVAVEIQRARLERAQIDAQDAEAQRAVLQARLDNADVKLAAAENELARKQTLSQRGSGSAVELEDTRAKRDSAAAALREAKAILSAQDNAIVGTRIDLARAQAELASAEATLPQKQASLQAAEVELDRTTIRSPIDGVIVGRNVNEGQTLATTLEARTLFIIAGDLRRMEIHAKVDETDIGKIESGQEAAFAVDAHPGRVFNAVVRQVRKAPQVQQNVVTYTVVLATDNPDNLLLPGMTAVARIVVAKAGPVPTVPLAALRWSPRGVPAPAPGAVPDGRPAVVWTLRDGEPVPLTVGVGEDDGNAVAIVGGALRPDDRVIVAQPGAPAPRQLFGIRLGF